MYSFSFPEMFSSARSNLNTDEKATLTNTKLLLGSFKKSLFGDPYFGCNLKNYIYEQNNIVLQDLIIDDIYVSIKQFMPQIVVERKDIKIISEKDSLYATINCINKLDNQPNMFQIELVTADNFNWR